MSFDSADRALEKEAKTLEDFGYYFNGNGEMRRINAIDDENSGYLFDVKPGDKAYNQKHYEAVGQAVTEEIYDILDMELKLQRVYVPVDASEFEARGFFFVSDNAWSADRLLILVHGSGVVRAGQWSRRLIMNVDINTGSQIPYIKEALRFGFGVVVLNGNLNRAKTKDGRVTIIRGSEESLSHTLYVWEKFIRNAKASFITIVAHSAGGWVIERLCDERADEFSERVIAVAFTDSIHKANPASRGWQHLRKVGRNWVTSKLPVGSEVQQFPDDIHRVSAGTICHEETSASAFEDIVKFILERHRTVIAEKADEKGSGFLTSATRSERGKKMDNKEL